MSKISILKTDKKLSNFADECDWVQFKLGSVGIPKVKGAVINFSLI